MTGIVLSFNDAFHGYGWIQPFDGGRDIWVHRIDLVNAKRLFEGDEVEFKIKEEPDGRRRALRVEVFPRRD